MSIANFIVNMDQKTECNKSELRDTRETSLRGIKAVSEMMASFHCDEQHEPCGLTNEVVSGVGHLLQELAEIVESCNERIDSKPIKIREAG
ncbi:MAG: hypothetical protein H8E32_00150 [Nitrospinae bacterium]|nr:hypothetical protein [Nitrospinota bacterium]